MADRDPHGQTLRIGTRGSQLARWQADWVATQLRQLGSRVELIEIATRGDVDAARSIGEIGTRGVFTKEIQRALLQGEIDLAVHSLKDLPTEPIDGLTLAAVPPREDPADVLVLASGGSTGIRVSRWEPTGTNARPTDVLADLPQGARIGTGSLRRRAQLRHARPDLTIEDIRGNVDTRLRKLDEGQFDAIVLAGAGLRRLGLAHRISCVLPLELMLPAVGQGALAIECRSDDEPTRAVVVQLDDAATHAAIRAERSLLAHLRGGCMAPVGALAQYLGDRLQLSAVVLSADGASRLAATGTVASGHGHDAEQLGRRVADDLLSQGAAELIHATRSGSPD